MENILVSVVVAVYNKEKYVKRCIQSLVVQTHKNVEIILVDDGSTDSSGMICDEEAKKDVRIQVLHTKNGGVSAARNRGIEASLGKYISFCDADDEYANFYVEKMLKACVQNQVKIAVGDYKTYDEKVEFEYPKEDHVVVIGKEEALIESIGKNHVLYILPGNKMFERSVLEENRYTEGRIHEDEDLMYRVYYSVDRIAVVKDVVYGYFECPDSIVTSDFSKKRLIYLQIAKEREIFFQERNEEMLTSYFLFSYALALLQYYPRVKKDLKMKDAAQKIKREYFRVFPKLAKSEIIPKKKKLLLWIGRIFPGGYAGIMRCKVKHFDKKK